MKWFVFFWLVILTPISIAEDLHLEKIKLPPELGSEIELPISKQSLSFTPENGRIFYIPIALNGKQKIKITISNAQDNTGDKGFTWRLVDSTLKEEFGSSLAKRKKAQSWIVDDIRSSSAVLILEDKNTKFDGKYPGNRFELRVSFP